MTDALIQRVAEALFESSSRAGLSALPLSDEGWRAGAVAAIGALVEPSAEMIDAARLHSVLQNNADEAEIWRVMARTALLAADTSPS
jgi:hypothetical protein